MILMIIKKKRLMIDLDRYQFSHDDDLIIFSLRSPGVSVYISAFTLMSIAIDRYFVILYPFKSRMLMKVCLLIIVTIWISAVFLTFPYAHFMEFVERNSNELASDQNESIITNDTINSTTQTNQVFVNEFTSIRIDDRIDLDEDAEIDAEFVLDFDDDQIIYYCTEQWPHEELSKMFGITTSALQFVIPFLIITYCYVKICAKLADRARTIPGNVSVRREEQERERTRKTNGMLISMVIIFVISWLPLNMFNLLADFYEEATQWKHQRALFLITHAIAMSSTCYNPFLYAWLNENFRKEFKEVLPCFALIKSNRSPQTVTIVNNFVEMREKNFQTSTNERNDLIVKKYLNVNDPIDDNKDQISTPTTFTAISDISVKSKQIPAINNDCNQNSIRKQSSYFESCELIKTNQEESNAMNEKNENEETNKLSIEIANNLATNEQKKSTKISTRNGINCMIVLNQSDFDSKNEIIDERKSKDGTEARDSDSIKLKGFRSVNQQVSSLL